MQLQHFYRKRFLPGFTLIEILVVISIIAVIITIAIVSYTTINKQSRDAKRKSDLEQIRSALEMYRSDNGYYPSVNTTGFGTAANLGSVLVSTYIPAIPTDPKSSQLYYFEALNLVGSNYYSYCVCAKLEAQSGSFTCTVAPPNECNYGVKNP